jgi:hypothetical protein
MPGVRPLLQRGATHFNIGRSFRKGSQSAALSQSGLQNSMPLPELSTHTSPGVQSLSLAQAYQRAVEPLFIPHVQWPAWQFAPSPQAMPSLTAPAATQRIPPSHWTWPLRHSENSQASPTLHATHFPTWHT